LRIFFVVITDLIRYRSTEKVRAYGVLDAHGRPIIDRARNIKSPNRGSNQRVGDIAIEVPGDSTELRGVSPWVIDREFARELWKLSEKFPRYTLPKLKSNVQEVPIPRRYRLQGGAGRSS